MIILISKATFSYSLFLDSIRSFSHAVIFDFEEFLKGKPENPQRKSVDSEFIIFMFTGLELVRDVKNVQTMSKVRVWSQCSCSCTRRTRNEKRMEMRQRTQD